MMLRLLLLLLLRTSKNDSGVLRRLLLLLLVRGLQRLVNHLFLLLGRRRRPLMVLLLLGRGWALLYVMDLLHLLGLLWTLIVRLLILMVAHFSMHCLEKNDRYLARNFDRPNKGLFAKAKLIKNGG